MKKSNITFEPATTAHAKEFYGDRHTKSFKGYAALLKGKTVGVGGLSFEDNAMVLFSDMRKEMRPFKREIVRAIYILGEMVKDVRCPILAVADKKEPAAEKLLTKLGFVFSGQLSSDGSKVFRRFP